MTRQRKESTRQRATLRLLLLGAAVTTTLVACGSNDPNQGAAATTQTAVDMAVPEALRFTAPFVGGGVQPGESGDLSYTFTEPGSYQVGCHQPGHYAAGMKIDVTVEQ